MNLGIQLTETIFSNVTVVTWDWQIRAWEILHQ